MFGSKKSGTSITDDWVNSAADYIERVIDGLRDKAVLPITTIARWIVYGILMTIVSIVAVVLLSIAFVRLLDVYLDAIPGAPEGVWLAHLVAGTIFVVLGLVAWSKKTPKSASER